MSKAVVLISGGMDSATAGAIAKAEGHELYAITFDYGQRHAREIEAAKAVAASLGALDHLIVSVDLRKIGGSALTDDIDVPLDRCQQAMAAQVPATYVPARNMIFLALALSYAESIGASEIFIGVSQVDYSGYPDCRGEFAEAFERAANLGTKAAVEGGKPFHVRAPLLDLNKADIIKRGLQLGVDYSLTWSCYQGGEIACGRCDSCRLRLAGFAAAGAVDPLSYV